MWLNFADLIHGRVADHKGRVLPADLSSGTYDLRDLNPREGGNLFGSELALDTTLGLQAQPDHLRCCGYDGPKFVPDPLEILFFGNGGFGAHALDCSGTDVDISFDFNNWWSGNSSIAQVTYKNAYGASPGFADGFASGEVLEGNASYCTLVQEQLDVRITVQEPDHLIVLTDVQKTIGCGNNPSTLQRTITYEVDDVSDNRMQVPFSMKENVPTNIVSSCNGVTVQTGATCVSNLNYQPGALGEFSDFLSPGCPNSPTNTPCGFVFNNQQWQWCPASGVPTSMGTIGKDTVDNTIIEVDGNILGFTRGKRFNK